MNKTTLNDIVPGKLYRITPQTVLTMDGTEKRLHFFDENGLAHVDGSAIVMALGLTTHHDYHYLKCLFQERIGFFLLEIGTTEGVFRRTYDTIELLDDNDQST